MIKFLVKSLPLTSKISSTLDLLNGSHPIPYIPSVG